MGSMKIVLPIVVVAVVVGVLALILLGRRSSRTDPKEQENQQGKQKTMMKLYRRDNDRTTAYHEAWINGSKIIEHWGRLGERGETREHLRDESVTNDEALKRVLTDALSKGFQPIRTEDHAVLLIEYRVEGMGTVEDLDKRHGLEDRMNDTLGWTGLGHCDGGSIGSGTMEVCCFVVDFETAKRIIVKDLQGTRFGDHSRIYQENAE